MTEKTLQKESADKMSFEEAMEKLEDTVRMMENPKSSLEDLLVLFGEARKLASVCQGKLDVLRQKIEILTKDRDGQLKWDEMSSEGIVESKNDFLDGAKDKPSGTDDGMLI